MIKEKEEEGARPSKINGSINKACCCACAGVPALTWVTGVHVLSCTRVWVRAGGGGEVVVVVVGGSSTKPKAILRVHGRTWKSESTPNLFGDVCGVWSTLLGLLLLNTSCLLQSVWSCLHYWYNKGGAWGAQAQMVHGLTLSLPSASGERVCFLRELRGKLGQIWN